MHLLEPIKEILSSQSGTYAEYTSEVIKDFWISLVSRECSLLGRKEVLTGKAKFGILGDGKEVPQVAMARAFQKGDFRSGYYRDQTLMMALDLCSVKDYFAQLYADPDNDPFSRGRQMNAHFGSPLINKDGSWLDHTKLYNISADISSTAGQMARALGLSLASKYYRSEKELATNSKFSKNGNEVCFCTIGDASTSEGVFWETLNAAAVMQVPLAVSVWDDGYGISVPKELQTVKQSISEALSGFQKTDLQNGIHIIKSKAWNYAELVNVYKEGIELCRNKHIPVLFHIEEVTQPQGHSTSGSHERYKSPSRMKWEIEFDCITQMGNWMIENKIITQKISDQLKSLAKDYVKSQKDIAWSNYGKPIKEQAMVLADILSSAGFNQEAEDILALREPGLNELIEKARRTKLGHSITSPALDGWIETQYKLAQGHYHSDVYSGTENGVVNIKEVKAEYEDHAADLNGYQILNTFFDKKLEQDRRFVAFGEDVGKIGDVNQGFAGLQDIHGENRVFDCGIREWTIIGQAIGMSMRGLRPLAEIQYLDYIVYALSALMDDLATLRYRSGGLQAAPAIIRTRGHRLEGIWHSGSPIGMLLNSLRGICICVPRNMTQAAGMYQTLLQSDDPGLVIECLNGYRLKEKLPSNIGEYNVPLGVVEVLTSGVDLTLVSYGSSIRIAEEACEQLRLMDIQVELIDVQCLIPFDLSHQICRSVEKTNKLLILDEDVPGGASAYLLQKILVEQNAYKFLDSPPITLSAKENRPPYGSSGDYFTKPNVEDVIEQVLNLMREYNPSKYA